jgi:ABC-2 type transport system permease protein
MKRLRALLVKEFIQMVRDPRTLVMVFLMPIFQLALLGSAANNDVKDIATVIFDQDTTQSSRELLDAMRASGFFAYNYIAYSQEDVNDLISSGKAKVGIIIPSGYSKDLATGRSAQVAVLIDGSDPTVAQAALTAATYVGQARSTKILTQQLASRGLAGGNLNTSPIDVRARVLYNPDLVSTYNMVPGIIALLLMQTTTTLTAFAIVRERERGTMEQLIVTPIRNWELVIAKITPYILVSILNTILVLFIATIMFAVPIRGSLILLLLMTMLYLLPNLGLGLLISTIAHTQQEAQFLMMPILLPSMLLSGFIFPFSSMPFILQMVGNVLPLTHFLIILRAIVIKGADMRLYTDQILILVFLSVLVLTGAALRFKKTLD